MSVRVPFHPLEFQCNACERWFQPRTLERVGETCPHCYAYTEATENVASRGGRIAQMTRLLLAVPQGTG